MRALAACISVILFTVVGAQEAIWMKPIDRQVHWNGMICDNQGDVYAYGTTSQWTHDAPTSTMVVTRFRQEGVAAGTMSLDLPFYNLELVYDGQNLFYFTAVFNRTFTFNGSTVVPKGGFDAAIGCMEKNGELKWISTMRSPQDDRIPAICFNADSTRLIVSGMLGGDFSFNSQFVAPSDEYSMFLAEIGLDGSLGKYRMFNFVPGKNGFSYGQEIFMHPNGDIILLAYREGASYTEEAPSLPYEGHYVYRISPDFDLKWERMLLNGACYYGHTGGMLRHWNDKIMVATYCSEKYGGTGTLHCLEPGSGNTLWMRDNKDGGYFDGGCGAHGFFYLTTDDANVCPCPGNFPGYHVLRETDHLGKERVILKAQRGMFSHFTQNNDGMKFVLGLANDSAMVGNSVMTDSYFIIGVGVPGERVTTGVRNSNSREVSIFPNPASTEIVIETSDALIDGLQLIDLHGRALPTHFIVAGSSATVDLGQTIPGTYVLEVRVQGAASMRKKVVVSR